jgi:hypothetical protein
MYLRVNENGDVVVPRNLEVLGNTTLDGSLEVKSGNFTVDLSGNVIIKDTLTVEAKSAGANSILGTTDFGRTTSGIIPSSAGVFVSAGGLTVNAGEGTGVDFKAIYSNFPFITGVFSGFQRVTSIPVATGTGAVQMESLYVLTLGTLRICFGKLGVLTSAQFNNNSISQIPANTLSGEQQGFPGLFINVYYLNIQAIGVSSQFGIVNCVAANDDGFMSGFNAGDLTQTKAHFMIVGKSNGLY